MCWFSNSYDYSQQPTQVDMSAYFASSLPSTTTSAYGALATTVTTSATSATTAMTMLDQHSLALSMYYPNAATPTTSSAPMYDAATLQAYYASYGMSVPTMTTTSNGIVVGDGSNAVGFGGSMTSSTTTTNSVSYAGQYPLYGNGGAKSSYSSNDGNVEYNKFAGFVCCCLVFRTTEAFVHFSYQQQRYNATVESETFVLNRIVSCLTFTPTDTHTHTHTLIRSNTRRSSTISEITMYSHQRPHIAMRTRATPPATRTNNTRRFVISDTATIIIITIDAMAVDSTTTMAAVVNHIECRIAIEYHRRRRRSSSSSSSSTMRRRPAETRRRRHRR
jgi:hypothetical protein